MERKNKATDEKLSVIYKFLDNLTDAGDKATDDDIENIVTLEVVKQ